MFVYIAKHLDILSVSVIIVHTMKNFMVKFGYHWRPIELPHLKKVDIGALQTLWYSLSVNNALRIELLTLLSVFWLTA